MDLNLRDGRERCVQLLLPSSLKRNREPTLFFITTNFAAYLANITFTAASYTSKSTKLPINEARLCMPRQWGSLARREEEIPVSCLFRNLRAVTVMMTVYYERQLIEHIVAS